MKPVLLAEASQTRRRALSALLAQHGFGVTAVASLAPGATQTYTSSYTLLQSDLDTNGGGDGRVENLATVDTNETAPLTDTEAATIIYSAKIDLTKYVSVDQGATWHDANTPTGPTLLSSAGFNPWFKYTALNNGTVTLKDVTLTDAVYDLNGDDAGTSWDWGDLAPGQTAELIFEAPYAPGQNSGDATVTATALTPVIDIDNAQSLAKDLGVQVQFVDSSFAKLVEDVTADKCDLAMFAVGITPARQEKLRFTQPHLVSDIYGITTKTNTVIKQWADIDKPGVLVGVQAGTFMEPIMAQRLKQATLVRIQLPATRERELTAGRIDVFMTDYPYSRRLMDNADWARLIESPEPFSVLPYGYAVKRGDAAWLATVESFVARIKADGRLQRAASQNGLSAIVVR